MQIFSLNRTVTFLANKIILIADVVFCKILILKLLKIHNYE